VQIKALKSETNQLLAFLALITFARLLWLYLSGHELYGDEAQYWIWSNNLSFGYYSKPPVVAWFIFLSTGVFGDSEFGVRFLSPVVHLFVSLVIYQIALELFDKKTAFWSALTYITLPAVFVSSALISTDPFLLLFWSLSLLCYIKAFKSDDIKWWMLIGVSAGLGMLSKYSMGLFLFSVLLHQLIVGKLLKSISSYKIWLGGFIALMLWLPNLWWNYNNSMASLNHTLDLAKGREESQFSLYNFAVFFISQFAVFGPVLFASLLYSFKKVDVKKYAIPLSFFVVFFVVIAGLSFVSRAHANWAAPAYIAAILIVVNYLISNKKLKILKFSFMLHLVLGMMLLCYALVIQNFDITLSKKNDLFRRVRGGNELGKQLDTYRMLYPNAVWATEDRMNLSTLVYYTKPHAFDIFKWNPSHQIKDHYDLTTNLNTAVGKNVIMITNYYKAVSLTSYGSSAEEIGCLYYQPYEGLERRLSLIMIKNFKGY